MAQAFNWVSACALRPSRPGAEASGHVWRTASRMKRTSASQRVLRRVPRKLRNTNPLVEQVIRSGPLYAVESTEGDEKRVLLIEHMIIVSREGRERSHKLVTVGQKITNDPLRFTRQRRVLYQNPVGAADAPPLVQI